MADKPLPVRIIEAPLSLLHHYGGQVLDALVDVVNEAYMYGEGDIFADGFRRTTREEVELLAGRRQLLVVVAADADDAADAADDNDSNDADDAADDNDSNDAADHNDNDDGNDAADDNDSNDADGDDDGAPQQQQQGGDGESHDQQAKRAKAEQTISRIKPEHVLGCMKLIVHEAQPLKGNSKEADGDEDSGNKDQQGEQGEQREGEQGEQGEVEDYMRVKRGEVGMFAVRQDLRSKGIGQYLFNVAQAKARERGCQVCELQLLYPRDRPHAVKDRLRVWYQRSGFSVVASGDFAKAYPRVAPLLNGPVCFDIFHKPL